MNDSAKRLLVLRVAGDICETEIGQLRNISRMLGMECDEVTLTDADTIGDLLKGKGPFSYIYLCGHASRDGMGDSESDGLFVRWGTFAFELCAADCLRPESVLLLACCRGGMWQVAATLFAWCSKIDYVCGPRWSVCNNDLVCGFHVFLYNMESRREQPSVAADRSSKATGYEFFAYDRVEIEESQEFREFLKRIEETENVEFAALHPEWGNQE